MSTRSIGHTVQRSIICIAAVVMIVLTAAGCGQSEPTATSVPATNTRIALEPTHTPLPPTATPVPPTETATPSPTVTPMPTATAAPTPAATEALAFTLYPEPGLSAYVRIYGRQYHDRAFDILVTEDGGSLIAGLTNNTGLSHRITPGNAWLIRTDPQGTVLWEREYGGEKDAFFSSIIQVGHNEYVLLGEIAASYERDETDLYLVKVDGQGNEIWSHTFGGRGMDLGKMVRQTADGGYIVIGDRADENPTGMVYESKLFLSKRDAEGKQVWSRTYGDEILDLGWGVAQTPDGGYVLTGWEAKTIDDRDVILIKTDEQGEVEWSRTWDLDPGERDGGFDLILTSDGYVVIACIQSMGSGAPSAVRIKVDLAGNEIWKKLIGKAGIGNTFWHIMEDSDGGYVMAGDTHLGQVPGTGEDTHGAWMVKTDTDGEILWQHVFGQGEYEQAHFYSAAPRPAGGYLFAGEVTRNGGTYSDLMWMAIPSAPATIATTPTELTYQITATPTPGPLPQAGANRVWEKDSSVMAYVPAGAFWMGSTSAEIEDAVAACVADGGSEAPCRRSYAAEGPRHEIYLDAFWIDRTEVTNAQYLKCVEAGICEEPAVCDWGAPTYNDGSKADHPVVCVDWNDARTYCQWAGKRLPTEAEWEKAARGTDGLIYPWGDAFDGRLVNFCDANCRLERKNKDWDDGYTETAPVGSYADGESPYGAWDMAGNVWEWVSDWYNGSYYNISPSSNPPGPDAGTDKVARGGAWDGLWTYTRTATRRQHDPSDRGSIFGIRCCVAAAEWGKDYYGVISADTAGQVERLSTFSGHSDRVNDLIFSGDGAYLASSSLDGTIKLWDAASWQEVHAFRMNRAGFNGIAFSPDGRLLACADAIWDVESKQVLHVLERHRNDPGPAAFSPDGSTLAVALESRPIKLWDVASGQVLRTFVEQPDEVTFSIAFSPDGTLLAAGVHGGMVRLWDVASGEIAGTLAYGDESDDVHEVAFSSDGSMLAAGGNDTTVRLWDVASRQVVHTLGHGDGLYGVAFSPNGGLLASACCDHTVKLWDIASGQLVRSLPHGDEVMAVAFSPDGTLLASGGYDHQISLWGVSRR